LNIASCGTMDSNDCLITVKPSLKREIHIESIVYHQFRDQIEKVINDTLDFLDIEHMYVHIQDKGALDYAIKARLMTAISRLEALQ